MDNGLSSNEVHDCLEDTDGTMLFATDRGLQRFDGNNFTSIPFQNESFTNSAVVFNIHLDSNSTIWISTYKNGLFQLDKDTLKPYAFNSTLLNHHNKTAPRQFVFGLKDKIYFTYQIAKDPFIYEIDSTGIISVKGHSRIDSMFSPSTNYRQVPKKTFSLFKIGNKLFFNKVCFAKYDHTKAYYENLKALNQNKSNIVDSMFMFYNVTETLNRIKGPIQYVTLTEKNKIWTSFKGHLFLLDTNFRHQRTITFETNVTKISKIENGYIVCTKKGAWWLYPDKNNYAKKLILKDAIVSNCLMDKENGLWLTTIYNGIFFIPNLNMRLLNLDEDLKTKDISTLNSNESILAITLNSNLLKLYSLSSLSSFYENSSNKSIKSIYLDNQYLESAAIGIKLKDTTLISATPNPRPLYNFVYGTEDSDTLIFATRKFGIQFISKEGDWFKERTNLLDTNTDKLIVLKHQKTIYVGDNKGVYILDRQNNLDKRFLSDTVKGQIVDIKNLGHKLIISSRSNGVFISDGKKIVHHLHTNNSLLPSKCGKIAIQNDSVAWISSFEGLFRLTLKFDTVKLELFNQDFGLLSNRINDISISGDRIFFATNKGLCYSNLNNFAISKNPIHFTLSFPNLSTQLKQGFDTLNLEMGKRDIYFQVNEKSTHHSQNLLYSYTLNDDLDSRIYSSANSVSFGNLNPGLNRISINIANANRIWNSEPFIVNIWVPRHLYEKSWFSIGLIALIISLVFLSIYLYFRFRDRRRKQQFDFALARYQTLSLQLSPHFIFNSLNNIQYLSISKNYVSVNQFVAKLAKLTRNILEHSKLNLISVETEIANLKLFLGIEVIRFEHKPIHIKFSVDPKLDLQNLLIPPMIIQPSVENAIWHGLLNKVGERKLELNFKSIKDGFKVEIKDNGIGLNTKQKGMEKIKGKTSIGVKNTKDRIKLYNDMELGSASFSLTELKGNVNEVLGTSAIFTFTSYKRKARTLR